MPRIRLAFREGHLAEGIGGNGVDKGLELGCQLGEFCEDLGEKQPRLEFG